MGLGLEMSLCMSIRITVSELHAQPLGRLLIRNKSLIQEGWPDGSAGEGGCHRAEDMSVIPEPMQ